MPVLDARMDELYWGLFGQNSCENPLVSTIEDTAANASLSTYEDLETTLKSLIKKMKEPSLHILGQLPDALESKLERNLDGEIRFTYREALPEAKYLLEIAEEKYKKGQILRPECAEPLYLRNHVAWKKRKKIRSSLTISNQTN